MTDPQPLVLLAEDEPLASMALRVQLEALDYRVLGPARDGHTAVALGACFPVDVALFDFRMPRLDGVEAARTLFGIAPTPVVLLTGVDVSDLPEPIPRPPIFATLTKPADLADLRRALTAALQAFQGWVQAEPARHDRVAANRAERETIAAAVTTMADGAAYGPIATRLLDQARRENRPILDIARLARVSEG